MEKRMVRFSTKLTCLETMFARTILDRHNTLRAKSRRIFDLARTILFVTILFVASECYASPSVDVPLRHWSYDAIEKLAIVGLCDIADIGIRPVSRIKMANIVKTAIDKARDYSGEFEWNEQDYLETLLNKLIDEFRVELVDIGVEVASTFDQPLPKNTIRLISDMSVEQAYGVFDSDNMLFENKDGWVLKDGINSRIKVTGWAKLADLYAVSITPGIRYSKDDTDLNIENAHLRINPRGWNTEFSIGRTSAWWGPGFHGSILMTDNAFPMDALRINNIRPFRLPGIFKKMGRWSGTWFISRMDKKFNLPHALVSGWKLDYIPSEFLKFGVGHILMFGGKGVNRYGFNDFVGNSSLFFSSGGGADDPENHIMSGDVQLFLRRIDRFLPIATGAKLYMEWGAEDEAKSVPVDLAHIIGAYFTDVFKIPGFDVKAEIAKFHEAFYSHFKYTSGYTRKGNFIGHHAGGDSEDIALSAIFSFPEEYRASFTFSHMRSGLTRVFIETTDQIKLEFTVINGLKMYNVNNVDVTLFYEFDDIENFENTALSAKNHILGAEVTRRF
ncbi:MAG: capsule assembly Wzi family protein [Candidatus Omnitrophota bacterium]|jgi:hypothetical protein